MGKSHSLFHIKKYCDNRGDIASLVLKLLSEDELKNFGVDFIRRIFKGLDSKTKNRMSRVKTPRAVANLPDHVDVLRKYARGEKVGNAVLTGIKVARRDLEAAKISRTLDSTEVALEFLLAFLSLLHDAGQKSLVLCVDEAEYIFSQTSPRKSAQVFNSIRAIYDLGEGTPLGIQLRPTANVIFFFGISVAGMEKLKGLERVEQHQGGPIQPLLTRVEKEISLARLTKRETEKLVEEYLRTERTPDRKKQPDPLIPYDHEFVEYVYSLTKGHPRETVSRCDYVITDGLKDHVAKLTKQYAKEVFQRWNVTA